MHNRLVNQHGRIFCGAQASTNMNPEAESLGPGEGRLVWRSLTEASCLLRRNLETEPRKILNGHEGGNPGYEPRTTLRATAPDPRTSPTRFWPPGTASSFL